MTAPRPDRIVYQPIIELRTGMVVGYEALSRFDHATPADVFAQARDAGEHVALERDAADLALTTIAPHLSEHLWVSVNVSPETLYDGIGNGLTDGWSVHPSQVVLEVTEHDPLEFLSLHRSMQGFLEAGGRLAIDDVGRGFSGLWHIVQSNPAALKVDRSLLERIDVNPLKRAAVRALVVYGEAVRTMVIAEGVETHAERDWLDALGVRYVQGYLYFKPMDVHDLPV